MIDGSPVVIGDTVYVLGIGSGFVTSVNVDGGFTVKTGNGEAFYRDGGYIGNQRRVYWSDPFIIMPPKNRRLWRAFVKVAVALYAQIEAISKFGEVMSDDEDIVEKS